MAANNDAIPMPVRREGETTLAFYHRLNEWESQMRDYCKREANKIDSTNKRSMFPTKRAITEQTKMERVSLHEHAENNPVLRNILKKFQANGGRTW